METKKHKQEIGTGIDKLHDDILIAVLSCMSLKDVVRTSVLSSRWRYLWMFTSGTLDFDDWNTSTGKIMKREKFKALVNRVLNLHQGSRVDNLVIRFTNLCYQFRTSEIDSWIHFAMRKKVKGFELDFSVDDGFHCCYKFPSIEELLLLSPSSAFGSLRCLKLVDVDIDDEVIRYLLASCPYIEHLCIRDSDATMNLEVVGSLPNLRELEISNCLNIRSMEIYATNLVSCTYQGRKISSPFKNTPNLTELTLGGKFCHSFAYEPNKHSSYSDQLVKLVLNFQTVGRERPIASPDLHKLYFLERLELNIVSIGCRSLFFFTSLIKASPNLRKFKIKIEYFTYDQQSTALRLNGGRMELFPVVTSATTGGFRHKNLKVIEMCGYIGLRSEDEFIMQLIKVAALSLDVVFIDTQTDYHFYCAKESYGTNALQRSSELYDRQRRHAICCATDLKRKCISQIKFVIT
ncbi:hypothetical protein ABFS82_09G130800 [Erythranthe guttata]|uniref:putative F-box protein At1g49610 n=1 Tax=Erythranthe guttata TaxID=4155 RepID=UPI00064D76B5|nr:PREDICTED: putative F-box protein At1g49610 [Erythranthe guttata]|eukprot:XP_012856874.1 PREDICTED: putative F-box protein At1g49610 [Erythranthe guttata]